MAKTFFDTLLSASAETLQKLKAPVLKNRAFRALDGAQDSYDEMKIDAEDKYDKARLEFVKGNYESVKDMVDALLDLDDIAAQKAKLELIKAELKGPTPAEFSKVKDDE